MSMRDEDLLEELELWPQWQLRRELVAPAMQPHMVAPTSIEPAPADTRIAEPSMATESSKEVETPTNAALTPFRLLVNNNASMLIVCDQVISTAMQTLLNNLLKVMDFSLQQDITDADASKLASYHGAVVLVMGESLGQTVLKQTLGIEQLRHQVHVHESKQVIVTYAFADLVDQPAHKARCWQDVCLAQLTIAHLKS